MWSSLVLLMLVLVLVLVFGLLLGWFVPWNYGLNYKLRKDTLSLATLYALDLNRNFCPAVATPGEKPSNFNEIRPKIRGANHSHLS